METTNLGGCGHEIGVFGGQAYPVLVCFYRDDEGAIQIASARLGGTLRLPWNPLAQ